MRNGQFSYKKRGTKNENLIKYIEMVFFYFVQHFYMKQSMIYEKLNILI